MSSAEIGAARAAAEGAAAEIEAIAAAYDDDEAEAQMLFCLTGHDHGRATEIGDHVYRARYRLNLLDPAEAPHTAALVFDECHKASGAGVEKITLGYRPTRLVANVFAAALRPVARVENECLTSPPRTARGVAEALAESWARVFEGGGRFRPPAD